MINELRYGFVFGTSRDEYRFMEVNVSINVITDKSTHGGELPGTTNTTISVPKVPIKILPPEILLETNHFPSFIHFSSFPLTA